MDIRSFSPRKCNLINKMELNLYKWISLQLSHFHWCITQKPLFLHKYLGKHMFLFHWLYLSMFKWLLKLCRWNSENNFYSHNSFLHLLFRIHIFNFNLRYLLNRYNFWIIFIFLTIYFSFSLRKEQNKEFINTAEP